MSSSQTISIADAGAKAAYEAALARAATESWAGRLIERDTSLWTSTRPSPTRSPTASAGSTRRPTSASRSRRSKPSARPCATPGSRQRSSAGWVAAASLRRLCRTSSGRSRTGCEQRPRLDRPGGRQGDLRRRRPAPEPVLRRDQVRHDDRAAGLPRRRLGACRRGPPHAWRQVPIGGRVHRRDHRPGPQLDAIPHHDELLERFLDPLDIGGRYAALTYVGLVPASLIGHRPGPPARVGAQWSSDPAATPIRPTNPALALGLALGTLAKDGRDKLTFVADGEIAPLREVGGAAHRREHRQARHGIVPVDLEPLGPVEAYGSDRVFVRLASTARQNRRRPRQLRRRSSTQLEAAGHPVIRIGSTTRSTSAASSSAGRPPRPSPGPSSASTRSTSPMSRRPKSRPASS